VRLFQLLLELVAALGCGPFDYFGGVQFALKLAHLFLQFGHKF